MGQPARTRQPGDRREDHELAYRVVERQVVQHRQRVELRSEHRADVGVGHIPHGDRPTAEGRQIDAVQRRKVRAETLEQHGHRGRVRCVGCDRDQRRSLFRQPGSQVVQSCTRIPRHRNDGARTHVGQLLDQLRSDVAGRTDDHMAAAVVQFNGCGRLRVGRLQARDTTDAGPVHELILAITIAGFGQDVSRRRPGGDRRVDVNDAAPDFGMFQCQRASQAPQHRMRRVGSVAVGHRLSIPGEHEQPRRQCHRGHRRAQPPRSVELVVRRVDIKDVGVRGGRVEHVSRAAESVGERTLIGCGRRRFQQCDRTAELLAQCGAQSGIGDHQPRGVRVDS